MGESFADRVVTRTLAGAIRHPESDELLLERDTVIDEAALATIESSWGGGGIRLQPR